MYPLFFLLINSLKDKVAYYKDPFILPQTVSFKHYESLVKNFGVFGYIKNTLIISVFSILLTLVCALTASYTFAKLKFKGKNIAFTVLLSLMMIPSELVVITNFVTITNLDLRNTFTGLILPSVASVFYIYLLKENFAQIPDELYLASKVDGTTDLKFLLKVVIPICKPTVITVVILKIIECWNSYVWPRLVTDNQKYFLVSNGIQ